MTSRKNPDGTPKDRPPRKDGRGRPPITIRTPLTRKQELFVKELVSKDGQITMREAAINAGWSAKEASYMAKELSDPEKYPNVVARIRAYRAELDEKYGVSYQRHLRDLQTIRDAALQNGAYSAAVMAEYRRGQAHGDIYISKSEVRHGSIDSMSKEEVLRALEELRRGDGSVTIDITPEEVPPADKGPSPRRTLAARIAVGPDFPEDMKDDGIAQ